MKKIGLIAGKSRYPIILAEEASRQGFSVVSVGIKGETLPEIEEKVFEMNWIEVGELGRLVAVFKDAGINKVIMAGGITKELIFRNDIYLDKNISDVLGAVKDNKDMSILTAFAHKLKKEGIELMNATTFLNDRLPDKGSLTQRAPNSFEWEDIKFGWDIAKEIARLDVGMTVVIKNKVVLALEGIDGTDETIKRGARLGGEACVVVKVSRPEQDMRFDLAVVGFSTIETMKKMKASVLAIEAKKTLFIEQDKAIEEANNSRISIVAI
ncbi:MAG: UDP-2,3-diacylglucosamine diphosphatase LpxI [Candidatus Omnitrophica bacterium]|nr:UDP-2,3-diacylglucosamine diphosphatase LpxI [Candidatus Omnitrophota bacterium]